MGLEISSRGYGVFCFINDGTAGEVVGLNMESQKLFFGSVTCVNDVGRNKYDRNY